MLLECRNCKCQPPRAICRSFAAPVAMRLVAPFSPITLAFTRIFGCVSVTLREEEQQRVRSLQEWELEKSLWLSIQCESVAKLFPSWRKKGAAIHTKNARKAACFRREKSTKRATSAKASQQQRPSAPRLVQIRQPASRRGRDADAATHAAAAGGRRALRPGAAAVGDTRCSLALALAQACRAAAGTTGKKKGFRVAGRGKDSMDHAKTKQSRFGFPSGRCCCAAVQAKISRRSWHVSA